MKPEEGRTPMADGTDLLLVEDDPHILAPLYRCLQLEGYTVHTAVTGKMGLEVFARVKPNLVVLDALLPEMQGFEVAEKIRQQSRAMILMLTACSSPEDRVRGLDAGADDYLVKPFELGELLARLRALSRRLLKSKDEPGTDPSRFAEIQISESSRRVYLTDCQLSLTPREFELLSFLVRHARHVLTRERIISSVWDFDYDGGSNVVDVVVRSLRKKMGEYSRYLQTVRGVGYVLREP